MIEESTGLDEVAESIDGGIKKLIQAINGLAAQKPPVVNVETAAPVIKVDAPDIPPPPKQAPIVFPKQPTRWEFKVQRDYDGRLSGLTATPIHSKTQ